MTTRRGRAKPTEIATGISACKCGNGMDRSFYGTFDAPICSACHQTCTFEMVTLTKRQERELTRAVCKPHVCKP